MQAFGRAARGDVRVYLVGGATAVLLGWRATTIDVDLVMRPEDDTLLRAIPGLKEELQVNVELASPLDFIPSRPVGKTGERSSPRSGGWPSCTSTSMRRREIGPIGLILH
jgi:hypothetical protein